MIAPVIIDVDLDDGPTDMEIIDMVAAAFDMTQQEAIDRLHSIDFQTARGGMQ